MQFPSRSNSPEIAPRPALAIATRSLTKCFQNRTVVDGLDLAIPVGAICGFVGPNGAGKTTTLRMLLGLVRPSSGGGRILGGDLTKPQSFLPQVGALIESPAFYPQLTGRKNLLALAHLSGTDVGAIGPLLERVGLLDRADDRFQSYSLGMKQRLGIAAALLNEPQLLLLDEPTNGLDPAGIVEIRGLVRALADDGITVVISSHLIAEIEQICDFLVIIRDGALAFQGPAAELRRGDQHDLLLAPEFDDDLDRLCTLLRQQGYAPEHAREADTLVIRSTEANPAALNRAAANEGITLRTLAVSTLGLEQSFFALTGASPGHGFDQEESGVLR